MSSLADSGVYAAKLISPRPKQVLYPSQKIKIEWKSALPHIRPDGMRDGTVSIVGWSQDFHDVHHTNPRLKAESFS